MSRPRSSTLLSKASSLISIPSSLVSMPSSLVSITSRRTRTCSQIGRVSISRRSTRSSTELSRESMPRSKNRICSVPSGGRFLVSSSLIVISFTVGQPFRTFRIMNFLTTASNRRVSSSFDHDVHQSLWYDDYLHYLVTFNETTHFLVGERGGA